MSGLHHREPPDVRVKLLFVSIAEQFNSGSLLLLQQKMEKAYIYCSFVPGALHPPRVFCSSLCYAQRPLVLPDAIWELVELSQPV